MPGCQLFLLWQLYVICAKPWKGDIIMNALAVYNTTGSCSFLWTSFKCYFFFKLPVQLNLNSNVFPVTFLYVPVAPFGPIVHKTRVHTFATLAGNLQGRKAVWSWSKIFGLTFVSVVQSFKTVCTLWRTNYKQCVIGFFEMWKSFAMNPWQVSEFIAHT